MAKSKPQPSFNLKKLKELRLRLEREKNLGKLWEYYMDRFADHPEFMDVGEPVDHPFLKKIIPLISQQLCKKDPHNIFLIKIPEYDFIHGSFWVESRIGGVIYFEEKLKGVIALSGSNLSGDMQFSRFTGQPLDNN
ncbi:hypothetical protein PN462_18445 [Spirulina sp. CS-785/01]|uniref:hypothetical protein n=1 Tax=Spirulina sp. CS-785/01 TaxID=3021716 RepID=UPI00232CDF6B|nr:hypothetical protein [Spirulina sp. CS-785/01]MDB9315101.1 hypothetical protein [Spirulina sp. CS-785/01]